jgi:hypothetical protein
MSAIASRQKCMILHVESGENGSQNVRILEFLTTVATEAKCPLHHISSLWIGPDTLTNIMGELKRLSSNGGRSILLVSGHYLEDQIAVCGLEALMEGFDVHLLCDLILARDVKLKPVLLLRLFQAGAVPSSLRQFLYMWQAAETDQHMSETLRKLLENFDSTFAGRPL